LRRRCSGCSPKLHQPEAAQIDRWCVDVLGTAERAHERHDPRLIVGRQRLRNDASGFPSIAFSSAGRWLATSGGPGAIRWVSAENIR
jgi:hypothetical protein